MITSKPIQHSRFHLTSPPMLLQLKTFLLKSSFKKLRLVGLLLLFCFPVFAAESEKTNLLEQRPSINAADSIIFDLASATLTPTYIDIPLYILSDDVINSFDFAMQFNLSKLSFSNTIELLTSDPTIISLAYFNPNDLFLRYTSSSLQGYPTLGSKITVIRFALNAPCTPISAADFTNVLTILNGVQCSHRFTNLNFNIFIPLADFANGPTCSNAPVTFSNLTSIANGQISTNNWTFSNGSTSGQASASTNFTASGAASATLFVTATNGCSDTTAKSFTINIPPTPIFSYTFDCVKDSVLFSNTSTISIGSVAGANWDFGDASNTSSDYSPVHHYNGNGPYTVTLVAISNFTCTAALTNTINLNNKVASNFTLGTTIFCIGKPINFVDASTYTLGTITAWLWDFGDGNVSNQQNPSYTYTAAGNYSVTLTAISTDGCKGKLTKVIKVSSPPQVLFAISNTTACAKSSLTFTDQSITDAGSNYNWKFGDGGNSSQQNPNYTYTTAGNYSVKLIVSTPSGCVDSLSKANLLQVYNTPNVNFKLSPACILSDINFTNTSTINVDTIVVRNWDFGDGSSSNQFLPSHTYTAAGTYSISLIAKSNLGCEAEIEKIIFATTKPSVDFSYNNFIDCSGDIITFNNRSTASGTPDYFWSFGDGQSSSAQNPSYTYTTNGYYPIRLVVTNPGGCADSLTKPYIVTLPAESDAAFNYSVTANGVVSFTNQSTNSVRSFWEFGDGQDSHLNMPIHHFPSINTYTVCLTAINSLNCKTSICKDIYVGVSRVCAIPAAFTPNNDGHNDNLQVKGGPFEKMEFRIYNQWGNLVFISEKQEEAWDGKHQGELQASGAYEYFFTGKTYDAQVITLYGIVNLTR